MKAYKYIKKNELGLDKQGNKATFPHPQYLLTYFINQFNSYFMFIMKTLIDAFICKWDGDGPWMLYRDKSVQCLTNTHVLYVTCAIIGLLLYYPVSTFIYPVLQFQNKILDMKYEATYIVANVQAKLLILASSSFFKSFGEKLFPEKLQLATTAAVTFALLLVNIRMRPCMIKWVNLIEEEVLFIVAVTNGVGFMSLVSGSSYLGIFLALPLIGLSVFITSFIYRRIYGSKKDKASSNFRKNLSMIPKDKVLSKSNKNI